MTRTVVPSSLPARRGIPASANAPRRFGLLRAAGATRLRQRPDRDQVATRVGDVRCGPAVTRQALTTVFYRRRTSPAAPHRRPPALSPARRTPATPRSGSGRGARRVRGRAAGAVAERQPHERGVARVHDQLGDDGCAEALGDEADERAVVVGAEDDVEVGDVAAEEASGSPVVRKPTSGRPDSSRSGGAAARRQLRLGRHESTYGSRRTSADSNGPSGSGRSAKVRSRSPRSRAGAGRVRPSPPARAPRRAATRR